MNFFKEYKKTTASVAAAIVLGTGTAVYFGTGDNEEEIDWFAYTLDVPTITVPKLNLPSLGISALDVPTLNVAGIRLNKIDIYSTDEDRIETENLDVPNVDSGDVSVPVISNVDIMDGVGIDVPSIDFTKIDINGIEDFSKLPAISLDMLQILESLKVYEGFDMSVYKIEPLDISRWVELRKFIKDKFADKRMIEKDISMFANKNIVDWLDIYEQFNDAEPVSYVPLQPFKMISEVRPMSLSKHVAILRKNLEFYKSKGYDSVLVTFYPDDDLLNIVNTVKFIKANFGMKVWLAYSGKESLDMSVFCDVDFYRNVLEMTAPYLDGYLNSWRRTSAHLWEQDKQFIAYTNYTLRKANPNIPIVGEFYYGNSWKYEGTGNIGFTANVFNNQSAVCLNNFGFINVYPRGLIANVIKPILGDSKLIAKVVGSRAYYASRNKNGLTFEQNFAIKTEIEEEFIEAGCIGTITLQDDGLSDTTNNLCETLYNNITGK